MPASKRLESYILHFSQFVEERAEEKVLAHSLEEARAIAAERLEDGDIMWEDGDYSDRQSLTSIWKDGKELLNLSQDDVSRLTTAELLLNEWLVDHTDDVFEEQPEVDEARTKIQEALDLLRGRKA